LFTSIEAQKLAAGNIISIISGERGNKDSDVDFNYGNNSKDDDFLFNEKDENMFGENNLVQKTKIYLAIKKLYE